MTHLATRPEHHLRIAQYTNLSISGDSKAPKASTRTPTIAIIDDDIKCLEILKIFFTTSQYSTLIFDRAEKGLDYMLKNKCVIDLVLLDVMLKGMSGLEFIEISKQIELLKHIPILLQSSTHQNFIENNLASPTHGCIYKPYTRRELFEKIDQILIAAQKIKCA